MKVKKSIIDKKIKDILASIVLTKKDGNMKDSTTELYKMRYGSEWKKYYPNL